MVDLEEKQCLGNKAKHDPESQEEIARLARLSWLN